MPPMRYVPVAALCLALPVMASGQSGVHATASGDTVIGAAVIREADTLRVHPSLRPPGSPVWSAAVSGDTVFTTSLQSNEFAEGGSLRGVRFPISHLPVRYLGAILPTGPRLRDTPVFSQVRYDYRASWLEFSEDGLVTSRSIVGFDPGLISAVSVSARKVVVVRRGTHSGKTALGRGARALDLPGSELPGDFGGLSLSRTAGTAILSVLELFQRRSYVIDVGVGAIVGMMPDVRTPSFSAGGELWTGVQYRSGDSDHGEAGRLVVFDAAALLYEGPWQTIGDEVQRPFLRDDGRYVFYERGRSDQACVLDVTSGEETVLTEIPRGRRFFSDDGHYLVVAGVRALRCFSLEQPTLPTLLWTREIESELSPGIVPIAHVTVSETGRLAACHILRPVGRDLIRDLRVFGRDGSEVAAALGTLETSEGLDFVGDRWLLEGAQFRNEPGLSWTPGMTTRRISLYDLAGQ